MEKHFACQIDAGVHGMVTGGSLGEASTLSFEEKLDAAVRYNSVLRVF
jgi:dihydrodipicolinate synthase/N-acetylneuraminate lyase